MSIRYNGWLLAAAITTVLFILGMILLTSAGKPAEKEAGKQTEQVSENSALAEHAALKKQPSDWRCFRYTGEDEPDNNEAVVSEDYEPVADGSCGEPETLCKVCFDAEFFHVEMDGSLDFDHPDNLQLKNLVSTESQHVENDGLPLPIEDSEVILYFREKIIDP